MDLSNRSTVWIIVGATKKSTCAVSSSLKEEISSDQSDGGVPRHNEEGSDTKVRRPRGGKGRGKNKGEKDDMRVESSEKRGGKDDMRVESS